MVEPKIQGRLLGQVVLYWIVCLIGIAALLLCWRVASCPTRPIYAHLYEMAFYDGPVLLAALLLLPLVALDTLRFSNRFFGPLSRLRRSMERLARGERVEPIEFRDADLWREFASEFNALLVRMRLHAAADKTGCLTREKGEQAAARAPRHGGQASE